MPRPGDEFDERLRRAIQGGKIVGGQQQQGPPPVTTREVTFRNVKINLEAVGADGIVQGFILALIDQADRTVYLYPFHQELKEILIQKLQELPDAGEQIPRNNSDG